MHSMQIPIHAQARRLLLRIASLVALAACTPAAYSQESLCIPNHEGLPNSGHLPPTVDGYVDRILGMSNVAGDPVIDQGWTRSSLVTFGPGGGLFPNAQMRVIKHSSQPFVFLGFVVQGDHQFHKEDAIVIVLDPNWTAASTQFSAAARRLIIHPFRVIDGGGAEGAVGVGPQSVRSDRQPFDTDWSRRNAANTAWVDFVAKPDISLANSPFSVRVRSWDNGTNDKGWSIEVKLPTTMQASGINEWTNLIGTGFGVYANVLDFAHDNSTGQVNLDYDRASQYTWPRLVGGAAPWITDPPPSQPAYLTLKEAANAAILPAFLGQATYSAANANCKGVRFANGPLSIGVRDTNGNLGTTIDGRSPSTVNTLAAKLVNDGAATDGKGVRVNFRIANWGIPGRQNSTWDDVPSRPAGQIPTVTQSPPLPLNQGALNSNPSVKADIPPGSSGGELWLQTQVLTTDNYCDPIHPPFGGCPAGSRDAHSCIWAVLSSADGATFSESSVRQNFDITTTSTQRRFAYISGKDWGSPRVPNGPQQFLLTPTRRYYLRTSTVDDKRKLVVPNGVSPKLLTPPDPAEAGYQLSPALEEELLKIPATSGEPTWAFVWSVSASRATSSTLTLGQQRYQIYEPAGEFGRVGTHTGSVDHFVDQITGGPELLALPSMGMYQIAVADGATAKIDTLIGALEPGEPDPTQVQAKLAIRLALGRTIPQGSFSNQHKGGLAATLGFEFILTQVYSLEATLGRHRFGGKSGGEDIDVTAIGVNGKLYFPQGGLKPFVTAGVGSYAFDPGSTRSGVNLGAGVQVDLAPQWSAEGRYTLNKVQSNAPNSNYSTLQVGLRYAF